MNMYRLMGRVVLALPMVAMAVPLPAKASVDLLATITKTKDIRVVQTVAINKNINIRAVLNKEYAGAAEADAVSNQLNEDNRVAGNIKETPSVPLNHGLSYGIERDALIRGSVTGNKGIVGVNQDVGNMVNQGNVVAVAMTTTPGTPSVPTRPFDAGAVTNSQAEADQITRRNEVFHFEVPDLEDPDRTAVIENSVNDNTGVVGVNQNSGNMNNQLNKLSIAIGAGAKVALSEAALGQVNANNRVEEAGTHRHTEIVGSGSNNSGIVGINQSTGNMNNQASVVSMAVLTSKVAITTAGPFSGTP